MNSKEFKKTFTFEERRKEYNRIIGKYPERIPIICEKNRFCKIPEVDKKKYLLQPRITIGQFMFIIRKRTRLKEYEALFLSIGGNIPPTSEFISVSYEKGKDPDGFLYIQYSSENTFG